MKLPELHEQWRRWDRFKAFHWGFYASGPSDTASHWQDPPIVVFDTQEVIVRKQYTKPELRLKYDNFNLRLVATNDSACPVMRMPDGTRFPKAWLNNHGQQYLLVDYDLGRAYRLGDISERVPSRFKQVYGLGAYYPGPDRHPVTPPIPLLVPHSNRQYVTDEERERVSELYLTCRAEVSLMTTKPWPEKHWSWGTRPLPFDMAAEFTGRWDEMDISRQWQLYTYGVERKRLEFDYLVLA